MPFADTIFAIDPIYFRHLDGKTDAHYLQQYICANSE
jgi:hypothetical protein